LVPQDGRYDAPALRPAPHRKTLIAALLAAAATLLLAAPTALAGPFAPERGGSPQADDIAELYLIAFYIGISIFLLVEGALIWSLVKYRYRRGGPQAAQIRGNAPLEIGWTLGAAFIVLVLTVVTFVYLDGIKDPPPGDPGSLQVASINQAEPPGGRTLEIDVNAQQYLFRFDYPGREQLFEYHTLVVPEDTTVLLNVTSSDVDHSWWAPKLGGKVDAVPGHVNETWFKASRPGKVYAVCAELCGDNHADMRAVVDVRTVEDYEAWAAGRRRDIRAAQAALAEQRRAREQQQLREREAGAAEPDESVEELGGE
jgi:cytochrome c oxidase subunit II